MLAVVSIVRSDLGTHGKNCVIGCVTQCQTPMLVYKHQLKEMRNEMKTVKVNFFLNTGEIGLHQMTVNTDSQALAVLNGVCEGGALIESFEIVEDK